MTKQNKKLLIIYSCMIVAFLLFSRWALEQDKIRKAEDAIVMERLAKCEVVKIDNRTGFSRYKLYRCPNKEELILK